MTRPSVRITLAPSQEAIFRKLVGYDFHEPLLVQRGEGVYDLYYADNNVLGLPSVEIDGKNPLQTIVDDDLSIFDARLREQMGRMYFNTQLWMAAYNSNCEYVYGVEDKLAQCEKRAVDLHERYVDLRNRAPKEAVQDHDKNRVSKSTESYMLH